MQLQVREMAFIGLTPKRITKKYRNNIPNNDGNLQTSVNKKIAKLYNKGESKRFICLSVGLSAHYVRIILDEMIASGILNEKVHNGNYSKYPDGTRDTVVNLKKSGMFCRDVCVKMKSDYGIDISISTVSKWVALAENN